MECLRDHRWRATQKAGPTWYLWGMSDIFPEEGDQKQKPEWKSIKPSQKRIKLCISMPVPGLRFIVLTNKIITFVPSNSRLLLYSTGVTEHNHHSPLNHCPSQKVSECPEHNVASLVPELYALQAGTSGRKCQFWILLSCNSFVCSKSELSIFLTCRFLTLKQVPNSKAGSALGGHNGLRHCQRGTSHRSACCQNAMLSSDQGCICYCQKN